MFSKWQKWNQQEKCNNFSTGNYFLGWKIKKLEEFWKIIFENFSRNAQLFHSKINRFQAWRHHLLDYHTTIVQISLIFGDFLKNCRFHQALTLHLFGVRSQPRYLRSSTPRAWSIAWVKSRVARLYARFFLCWSERNFWNFSSGDVHRPRLKAQIPYIQEPIFFQKNRFYTWSMLRRHNNPR